MKVYLSGPMSGLPESNFPAFNHGAKLLRGMGVELVNPAELNPGCDAPPVDAPPEVHKAYWQKCLRVDVRELTHCDAIVLLPGWEYSSGAHLELHNARQFGLLIATFEQFVGEHPRGKAVVRYSDHLVLREALPLRSDLWRSLAWLFPDNVEAGV